MADEMDIVNIADYRPPKQPSPFTITFIGFTFTTPEGDALKITRAWDFKSGRPH